jgi:non-specific serine/threonine protein kinase
VIDVMAERPTSPEHLKRLERDLEVAGPTPDQVVDQPGPSRHAADLLSVLEGWGLAAPSIDRYELLEVLGVGGMGVAIKARDRTLQRVIVLKFLPTHLSTSPDARRRFMTEARAASAIDHPNICTIHEINETPDGRVFIAMAFYAGETLDSRIAHGIVPLTDAVELTIQLGRGLAAAHRKGIIHRDVKPSNVVVTEDGVAKLIDFGVAKLEAEVGPTRTGAPVGTVAYMSPEQAQGIRVDARADIWSLGAVLYELLTGQPPFQRANPLATQYAIQHSDPPPPAGLRADVPAVLEAIVRRALMKRPDDRYQQVGDMVEDLEEALRFLAKRLDLGLPRAAGRRFSAESVDPHTSVVVLPFDDLSPLKDQEYFSQGLTEEITADLSKVSALRVISRTSAMIAKGTGKDVRSIREELNVGYVLEGSVSRIGTDVRIAVQLIDTADDAHVWAEKYTGTLDDVFSFQERIATAIVQALQVKLRPEERRQLAKRTIPDVHAFECYLKARHDIYSWTEAGLGRALHHLNNGLRLIGENTLLYAGSGFTHLQYVNAGIGPPEVHLAEAASCAARILDLDPASPHGFRLRGLTAALKGEQRAAVKDLKRALEGDPNDPDALLTLSLIYGAVGRCDAAFPLADHLLKIDPLTPINYWIHGWLLWTAGSPNDALPSIERMYAMNPDDPMHRLAYANILAHTDRIPEARAALDRVIEDTPASVLASCAAFMKYALERRRDDAFLALTPEFIAKARADWFDSWIIASFAAFMDDAASALEWLRNAVRLGFTNHPFLASQDGFLGRLRGTDEYESLLEEVRIEWLEFPA